jgi:PadR family transcriptional regulator PadR
MYKLQTRALLARTGQEACPTGRLTMVDCLPVDRIELIQGTLDLMILQTLQWGPRHGHGIGQAIRVSSQDGIQVEHGSLYPALHRLERRGWLAAEWKMSEANRRARYYRLTPMGRKQLAEEQSKWKMLVRAVARTMKPIRG